MTPHNKIKVGLLGPTGNLGSTFLREFELHESRLNFEVGKIGRPGKPSEDFNITEEGIITSRNGDTPEIIINLSNCYYPQPNSSQKMEMELTILGVAESISKTIEKSGCSVITASTYFQYYPDKNQHWSYYSELKTRAKEIIEGTAISYRTKSTDFVLYDNYGGVDRNKFVDLLEKSLSKSDQINCTDGKQVLNLTHVSDLARAFISEVNEQIQDGGNLTYELKSQFTVSLRELVAIAERAARKRAFVNWGVIPYREREIFELWDTGLKSPNGWSPKIDFASYIEEKFQKC